MSFGNKLKIVRVSHRLDQDAISKRLNVSQPVYSRYENDEKEVNENNALVKKVAEEFHIDVTWLLSQGDEKVYDLHTCNDPQKNYGAAIPKELADAIIKQQHMMEQMMQMLIHLKTGKK